MNRRSKTDPPGFLSRGCLRAGPRARLRKIVKNRGRFPSDEAASKLLYLALRNIEKDWKMPPITWRQAVNQFAILFGERFTAAIS